MTTKKNLRVIVVDKIATYLQRDGAIVCGNSDYQIVFTFDDEWDGITKTARFICKGKEFKVPIRADDTCDVPVIQAADEVIVGVFADGIATTPVVIPCKRSILCSS